MRARKETVMAHYYQGWIAAVWLSIAAAAAPARGATLFLEDAAMPAWSPDGNTIACVRVTSDKIQVWLAPRGGVPVMITHEATSALWPVWLSDGKNIVYFRQRRDANGSHREFVIADLHGQPQTAWEVADFWDDIPPTLSPDGRSLLYSTFDATLALDLTTGVSSPVAPGVGAMISPDGQWVAYVNANRRLVVGPPGGAPVHDLGGAAVAGFWTADSRFLVLLRYEGGEQTDLVLASRDGSSQVDITDDPEMEWGPRLSPDDRQIAYTRSLGE